MRKNIIFLLFIVPLFINTQAQSMGGGFWINYTVQGIHSESFDNFIKTYNDINQLTLDKPFKDKFKPLQGFGWNLTYLITDGFDFRANIGNTSLHSNNTAVYTNGEKRSVDFKINDVNIDMGFGFGSNGFFFNINFGMLTRWSYLYASYIFSDGTESFGQDHKLNGIYDCIRLTGLLGATIGIPINENIQLIYRMDYVLPAGKDVTYRATFQNLTEYKETNDAYFPQDMFQYVADPIDLFNNTYNDFQGLRYTLGLQFVIGDF